MASHAAAAMPHALPSIPASQITRVRPPRFLPGQFRDDQLPQPEGDAPHNAVWSQGKWRNPASNAAIDRRKVMSQQMKKALENRQHGSKIYAYYHVQTKQVVYSTTRVMQSGQVMPQLVNHGKKTVPEALRRDYWRPYFSIHFPENDGGRKVGLLAYQRLREFAMRRQLDPPPKSLMTTQADVDKAVRDAGSPLDVRERYLDRDIANRRQLHFPLLGQKLPQRLRAQKLMNQKASSVADAAFVLDLAMKKLQSLTSGRYSAKRALAQKTRHQLQKLGQRGRKRLRAVRSREEEKESEIAQRRELASNPEVGDGKLPLDKHIADQLSMEVGALVAGKSNRVIGMSSEDEPYDAEDCNIHVLWADLRDGTFAESWPSGVSHGELQPAATSKREVTRIIQSEFTDEDGILVSEQRQRVALISGSSVHIHGNEKPLGFQTFQQILQAQGAQRRQERLDDIALEQEQQLWELEEREFAGEAALLETQGFAQRDPKARADEPEIVLPDESKGLWARVKGVFGR